jgi:hypothetical protein
MNELGTFAQRLEQVSRVLMFSDYLSIAVLPEPRASQTGLMCQHYVLIVNLLPKDFR